MYFSKRPLAQYLPFRYRHKTTPLCVELRKTTSDLDGCPLCLPHNHNTVQLQVFVGDQRWRGRWWRWAGGGLLSGHIFRCGSKTFEFSNDDRYGDGVKGFGTKSTAAAATELRLSVGSFADTDGFGIDGLGAIEGIAGCACAAVAKDKNTCAITMLAISEKDMEKQSFDFICRILFRTVRPH